MPAGIVTRSVRLRSVRPSPWQVSHGVSMILPSPWQRGQALTLTIWPSIVWRTERTSPRPLHCGQVIGSLPALAPLPWHVSHALEDGELDLLLGALDRLLERDPQVVAQVGAGLRSAAPRRGGPGAATEERVEDVGEAAEPFEAARTAGAAGAAVDPGPPEHVVALAALRIGQDLVGLVDLLEPLVRRRVGVDVGMPLLGELAEGALDVGVGRAALDAQDHVEVAFGRGHG